MNEIPRVETITPEEAGNIVGKSAEWIRAKIRQGVSWGDCTQVTPGQWNYLIIKSKFLEYLGQKSKKENDKLLEEILNELKKINQIA